MKQHKMFAEELRIRDVLCRLRSAALSEQERYSAYLRKHKANKAVEGWRDRIVAYTDASNLISDYLSDYTLNLHGVLKHVRQAEEEAKVAKTTLLYIDQLHGKKARREAVELAEKLAYKLMGEQVDLLEPQLRTAWAAALEEELAIYSLMVEEGHA